MSLIGLIVLLLIIGLVLGFIQRSGYIDQTLMNIIYGVIVLFLIIIILRALGFWPGMTDLKI